jgi:S1-C subfamily serine protease
MGVRFDGEFEGAGIRLQSVVEDSPAAKAGFLAGDVVIVFGGKKIESPRDVVSVIRAHAIGDTVEATVLRDGKEVRLTLTFGPRPSR